MKHRKYLLIILLISLGIIVSSTPAALAQYQITAAQYPAIGTASTFEADTTGNITVVIGAGGTGQTWDYTSNLVGLEYQSQFIDPSSQDYAGTFPTAQWAIESYQYLSMDAMPPLLNEPIRGLFTLTYLELLEDNIIYGTGIRTITPFYSGNFPYQQDAIHYPMPLEKGKSWVREANYAAMQVDVEVSGIGLTIDIHMTDSSYIEVDASGDLTIPLGTFPVLRLKIRRTLTIEIFLSSHPGGDPLYSTVESIIMYEWHTQDAGMLLQVSSHGDEEEENFTDAGLVVRIKSSNVITDVECDPEDCGPLGVSPSEFLLSQNFPNPFNPSTSISYALPEPAEIELKIFTILGQDVAILESGIKNSGKHQVFWDGKDQTGREVSAGIYFYRLTAVPVNNGDTVIQTKKMVMNK